LPSNRGKLLFLQQCFSPGVGLLFKGFVAAAGVVGALSVAAAPQLPKDDSIVLERLPSKAADPAAAELKRLRAAASAAPESVDAAARLARRYFELAMAEGDPRYVGYAEAVLRRWPETASTPAELLVLQGLLRQYRHDFDRGLVDFDLALSSDPANTEALAWRAAILMVRADYAGARRECERLAEHSTALHATACAAYIEATTGQARRAHERLAAALAARSDVPPEFQVWVLTRLAEMAWRYGDPATADRHFRAALALGLDDNFLLAAYADFLLEQKRAGEVAALLKRWVRSDTLLLRLALAERALGLPEAAGHTRTLGERFAEASLRGERLHLQEEARYLLDLKGDAPAALAAAAENYQTQREPRDALVLLEAALAAREPAAAAPALKWLDETGFEGTRIREVAGKLKGMK
jgi:Tfp pilus assembly protein PilF